MKLDRTKNAIRNFFWGIINRVITLLLPFIARTIIINSLGAEYLGLNNLFTSILNVLSLAELGVGTALVYAMYKPIAEENQDEICSLLKLYRSCYRVIGAIILAIGILIIPFLPKLIHGTYPNDINLYILYVIYLSNTVLSYFLFAYKQSLLQAHQRTDVSSNVGSIVNIALNIIQIVVLIRLKNYYLYVILKPIFTVINNITIAIVTKRMYPNYSCRGNINKEVAKTIAHKVKALVGHKIGTTVITSADNLVISAFLGLTAVAIYGNYYYIMYFIIGVMGIAYSGVLAGIGNSLVTETEEKNYQLFNNMNFLIMWVVSWCSVCFLCLYQPFMKIWMGEDMMFPMPTVILLVIYYFTWQMRVTVINFKDAAGIWNADFWKPYVAAIVNLFTNILLVNLIGINGVFISTLICMALINFPWETNVLFKELFHKSPCHFYLRQCIVAIRTVFACLISAFVCSLVSIEGIPGLILKMVICVIVPNALFVLLSCKTTEFRYWTKRILKLKK